MLLYLFFTYQLSEAGHTLFIYNIGPDATEIELYGLFGPFGAITKVHIQVQLHSAISVSKQLVMEFTDTTLYEVLCLKAALSPF